MTYPQLKTMQNEPQSMNPDELASSLAFATNLSEQMLPKDAPQESPQTLQDQPGQAETPQSQETPPSQELVQPEPNKEIESLTKDFTEFKGKIEGLIETKFNELTKTIKDAVSE